MSKLKEMIYANSEYIITQYHQSYSVSDIIEKNKYAISTRKYIVELLKNEGIYQGVGGLSALYKQNKIKTTCMERYGVENIAQHPDYGWKNNNIEKINISFKSDIDKYKESVISLTKINKKYMIETQYCYYTGIKFADDILDCVNPNDYLKRSLDHKIPIIIGFFNNIEPEIVSSLGNLVWCLKYCNTIKNNMTEDQFKPLALHIRERLINEGKESN